MCLCKSYNYQGHMYESIRHMVRLRLHKDYTLCVYVI